MGVAVLTRSLRPMEPEQTDIEEVIDELTRRRAVRVEGDSVILNPEYMEVGRFYFAELKGEPYLYRKVSDQEIEVYGLAGQD